MRGTFITFEGIDGSGKSTQLRLLAEHLSSRSISIITTREPGGTPLGRHLRAAFLETEEVVVPLAELLAFASDRAQHVETLIKPSLAAGKVVISDRYADATTAYQGAGRELGPELVAEVIRIATGGLKPDLTLFLDINVEEAITRTSTRDESLGKTNRMDREHADFYSRVREAYLAIANDERERFIVIPAEGSVDDIQSHIRSIVDKILDSNVR